MKKVLVTGGTGFIGNRVCNALKKKNYIVDVVSRNPEKAQAKLTSVDAIHTWQPESEQLPPEAKSDVNAVIHLAGETIAGRWNANKKRRIRESRILSTRNQLSHCSDKSPGGLYQVRN